MGLGGEENLAAALAQCGAVIVEAAGVGRGRITVGYPLVERAVNDGNSIMRGMVAAIDTGTRATIHLRRCIVTSRNASAPTPS